MKKIFTLSLLFASLCGFAQKINLALNLKQDSTYYLTTNGKVTIVQDLPGQQQIITTTLNGTLSHKVTAVHDSVYVLEVKYKKLGMRMEIGGKTMSFSSDDSLSSNPASKMFAAMLNVPFTVVITKSAKVLEVKNVDNIYAGMFKAMPQLTDAQKTQFKSQMQQSFGEKAIKTNLQDAFIIFPGHSVKIGELWQNSSSLESILSCKTLTTYSLKDQQANTYTIHGDAVISANDNNGEYKPVNGLMMRYEQVSGTETIEQKFDKATCWVTGATVSKKIKATVKIQDSPSTPGGLTFPSSFSIDLTVTN
ncbi:MAG: DUF6263 family protein [Sphingobacteriales bacterium]